VVLRDLPRGHGRDVARRECTGPGGAPRPRVYRRVARDAAAVRRARGAGARGGDGCHSRGSARALVHAGLRRLAGSKTDPRRPCRRRAFRSRRKGRGMTDDGMRIRREVLGDEHVDRAVERTTKHTRDFQDFITRYAWGEIWSRPGLDRRTRSCITLTALVALG